MILIFLHENLSLNPDFMINSKILICSINSSKCIKL